MPIQSPINQSLQCFRQSLVIRYWFYSLENAVFHRNIWNVSVNAPDSSSKIIEKRIICLRSFVSCIFCLQ